MSEGDHHHGRQLNERETNESCAGARATKDDGPPSKSYGYVKGCTKYSERRGPIHYRYLGDECSHKRDTTHAEVFNE
ncbi:hypothetical protein KIN20_015524 [Parelaphostrongylus tenuis]|uniref:Uncharacterized protein n=1 Tax=Parelaphostrongylus tenuis TaxID=148309 RepID=A0AAD5QP39_PARTN|nr:hypothetical protein KIN20_015524 [Parelaphostrongylus tenuis]